MYCHNCGKQITDGSHFCPECGAEQVITDKKAEPDFGFTDPEQKEMNNREVSEKTGLPQKENSKKKISGLSIVAVFVSMCGGLGFIGTILAIIDIVKNKKNNHGFSIVAIILGIIMTYCFLPDLVYGSSNSSTPVQESSVSISEISTDANSDVSISTPKISEQKSDKSKSHIYSLNDVYSDENVKISMVEAGQADGSMLNEYEPVKDGYKIVYADFNAENVGKDSISVMYTDFEGYADNVSCEQYYGLTDKKEGMDFASTLSAGRKCSGTVAFEIPENTKNFEIEYKPNIWIDEVITFDVPMK